MKKCLACNTVFPLALTACQHCSWMPSVIDGFSAYAPDLAYENDHFIASHFAKLAPLEAKNFWFRARNKLIIWALSTYAPQFQHFLEIGCGTGFVLADIADKFPHRDYKGCELLVEGLSFASARQKNTMEFMQMDARHIPFEDEFDCIGAFDILEHIEEDERVLQQINQALKKNGLLFMTVPQHAWLWSQTDEFACHVRRYRANDLHQKIKQAGFEIVRSTSFVTSLLPVMIASRYLKKRVTEANAYTELDLPAFINKLFEKLLTIEIACIAKGINFPIGGSRLVIAKRS